MCNILSTGGFVGFNHEMRELATVISRDIYLHDPDVKWNDIIGVYIFIVIHFRLIIIILYFGDVNNEIDKIFLWRNATCVMCNNYRHWLSWGGERS